MIYGPNQAVDYELQESLNFSAIQRNNYLRIQIDIDKKEYSEMDDSSDETRNYIIDEFNSQFLNNATLLNNLNKFIVASGI